MEKVLQKNKKRMIISSFLYMSILTISIISPILMFIFTYIIANKYLAKMFKSKILHMSSFYGIKNTHNQKLSFRQNVKLQFDLFLISITGLILVCPYQYHPVTIFLSVIMFLFTLQITKFYIKKKKININNSIIFRNYYFKFSIIIGIIYSILIYFFDNDTSIIKAGYNTIFNGNICSLTVVLNDFIQKIIDFIPSPLDTLFTMIFSIQIVSGFIFTLYSFAFIQLNEQNN